MILRHIKKLLYVYIFPDNMTTQTVRCLQLQMSGRAIIKRAFTGAR